MYFDVLIVGDLRVPGGTSRQAASQIRVLHDAGYRVGLVAVELPHARGRIPIDAPIRERIALGEATVVHDPDDSLQAGLVVFDNARAFVEPPSRPFHVRAESAIIVVHFPLVDGAGRQTFDPDAVIRVVSRLVDCPVRWAPTSNLTRRLMVGARPELSYLADNVPYMVFADSFRCSRRSPVGDLPVIGRHSRPQMDKWPDSKRELLKVYPRDPGIRVELLGAGRYLRELMGSFPRNWRTYAFGEEDPADFLRRIDFFVYYHHSTWREAFGIVIAEAMASGAVVIVPPYFRENFGDAVLSRNPEEVVPTVLDLYGDWERYRKQSRRGARFVRKNHSPEAYLEIIAPLVPPRPRDVETKPTQKRRRRFDVVVFGDMSQPGAEAMRISEEIKVQTRAGYRTAVLHLPSHRSGGRVRPEIDVLVRRGEATALDPRVAACTARLLVVHSPRAVLGNPRHVRLDLAVSRTLVIVSRPFAELEDAAHLARLLEKLYGGRVSFAPTTDLARTYLEECCPPVVAEPDNWAAVVSVVRDSPRRRPGARPHIGRMELSDSQRWIADAERRHRVFASSGKEKIRVLGVRGEILGKGVRVPDNWELYQPHEIEPWKFIDRLDIIAYVQGHSSTEVPDMPVVAAMAKGIPPVLSGRYERHFGSGALYVDTDDARREIRAICRDPVRYRALSTAALERARRFHSPEAHLRRLARLIGEPRSRRTAKPRSAADRPAPSKKRVIMFSQNGVGLGHVVRQLAIAHHLSRHRDVVFASMSQALDVIDEHGYQVEFVPSHVYTGVDYVDWFDWTREQLDQMIEFYDAGAVVLDGSIPYVSLIEAVAPRPDVCLVWVRRAMWRPGPDADRRLRLQRFFDLVVEPADIAEGFDRGPTVAWRQDVTRVDPIRLLERSDLLSRDEAARRLGLDPSRPAMLIQLGSGTNRDVVGLIDRVVAISKSFPDLQVVIAEWLNAPGAPRLWDDATVMKGFPIARVFNAFDFSISAAGYNSFHDLISFGLPTVFVGNPRLYMDDQVGRARFAAGRRAALVSDGSAKDLEEQITRMMDARLRSRIRRAMKRLSRPNGALDAARAIDSVIDD